MGSDTIPACEIKHGIILSCMRTLAVWSGQDEDVAFTELHKILTSIWDLQHAATELFAWRYIPLQKLAKVEWSRKGSSASSMSIFSSEEAGVKGRINVILPDDTVWNFLINISLFSSGRLWPRRGFLERIALAANLWLGFRVIGTTHHAILVPWAHPLSLQSNVCLNVDLKLIPSKNLHREGYVCFIREAYSLPAYSHILSSNFEQAAEIFQNLANVANSPSCCADSGFATD